MQKRKTKDEAGPTAVNTRKSSKRKAAPTEAPMRSVALALLAPDAKTVSVVGEFNNWQVESHPLQQSENEEWHITLQLPLGIYQYKFVIDGARWEDDADNPKRTMNEFGTSNSILEVV